MILADAKTYYTLIQKVNNGNTPPVMPQLRSEILCQDRGCLSKENLKRHIRALSQRVDTLKMVPLALPAGCPPSNDPLFKVSEARPPRSNHTRDGGVTPSLKNIE